MKIFVTILWLTLAVSGLVHAQANVFHQADFLNSSYEDLSDFLRRYPGMYPMDYGTLGAPMIIRPWNLNPWQMRVERDGILQSRISDGLYDSNLQPPLELDSMRYDFLAGGAGGKISMITRSVPLDTPLTEFHIREGFYGYGTVDFAHGQRVYRTLTLELTGRLAWYNGMRDSSAARFNRVRGRFGLDLGTDWRTELIYAGSHTDTDFPFGQTNPYSEREEAILSIHQKDSARSTLDPTLSLFRRQDRERWGNPFRLRELVDGWNVACHAELPLQRMTFRQNAYFTTTSFPIDRHVNEIQIELEGEDSLSTAFGDVCLNGAVRHTAQTKDPIKLLPDAAVKFQTAGIHGLHLHGGVQYVENTPPLLWIQSSYPLINRPLDISPEFVNVNSVYNSDSADNSGRGTDKFLKTAAGLLWKQDQAYCDLQLLTLHPQGRNHNEFGSIDTTVFLAYTPLTDTKSSHILNSTMSIPLRYGLRLDSWWYAQYHGTDFSRTVDSRGYARLYFERNFFTSPLTIRSHISYEYINGRYAFSNNGIHWLNHAEVVGFRISASIRGVTLIWGTENVLKRQYDILPGYKMIGKEEYIAFVWKLWL